MNTLQLVPNTDKPLSDEEIATFHSDGYVILKGFFSEEEVRPLHDACVDDPDIGGKQTQYTDSLGQTVRMATWTQLGDTLLGLFPRTARLVQAAQTLLDGREVYHWHSKLVKKEGGDPSHIDWHQGYGAWYDDGCLFPDLISCSVAITENTLENGAMQIIKRSHHLGRINHVVVGETMMTDPDRMVHILNRLEVVDCLMQPGDTILFHANTLHASKGNASAAPRILLHTHYNAADNAPVIEEGQGHHQYQRLEVVGDDAIGKGRFTSVFDGHHFFAPEKGLGKGQSIARRAD